MNKCFTYKGFDDMDDAFEYARSAIEAGASYTEIMICNSRMKYVEKPIIVQHNARRWIENVHSDNQEK